MNVKQKLSILFYLKRKKATKEGKNPIYVRLTIDGMVDEMSTGHKVLSDDWDNDTKRAKATAPDHKKINKVLRTMETDLERHFDLMLAKHSLVTPSQVKYSYKSPIKGEKDRQDKVENATLSTLLSDLILKYIKHNKRNKAAFSNNAVPSEARLFLLHQEKEEIYRDVEALKKKWLPIFDDKDRLKTLVLAVDDYLLNFLELCLVEQRSPNTLEKMIGRKARYLSFLQYRHDVDDIPLKEIEYSFMDELYNFSIISHKNRGNSAMKYCQWLKEVMERAASKGWVSFNVFSIFKCRYTDPKRDWISLETAIDLLNSNLKTQDQNEIRDIYIFQCFCGLSYQEVYSLEASDLIIGIDGKIWIDKDRQKTGANESVPLLPICIQLLERYKSHPVCQRRGKLFPVPSNQHYNRVLKEIAEQKGIKTILRTHKARFFFANEVTFNMGVQLKTVSRMLGHKSIKTTEVYVRANKKNISESMEVVQEKMFETNGKIKGVTSNSENVSKNDLKLQESFFYTSLPNVQYSVKD